MSRVALRTLTEKSQLKFGKYYDLTVRQVIDLYHIKGIRLLRWYYYQSSNISFSDEVLNEIGIHSEIRIPKPSKVTEEEMVRLLKLVDRNKF